VFCGAFETKRLGVEVDAVGTLTTIRAGRRAETCSKEYKRAEARANGQEIIHETERTRFRLGADAAAVFNSATPP
jgi:hypothetical protein